MGIIHISTAERVSLAKEIVRRIDTVTLLRCEEVADIHMRALVGEFDNEAKDLMNND
jgi:hypothetical protein